MLSRLRELLCWISFSVQFAFILYVILKVQGKQP